MTQPSDIAIIGGGILSSRPSSWYPTSAAQVVAGAGHWLMEEAPKTVIPAIADFVG